MTNKLFRIIPWVLTLVLAYPEGARAAFIASDLGTVISSGPGNLLFRNIPPSTSDPYVDFFIPIANTAITTVPEPATLVLLIFGFAGFSTRNNWQIKE